MDNVQEIKCQACGGPLRYDPEKAALICDHCGSSAAIPEELQQKDTSVEGLDFNQLYQQATQEDAQDLPVYNCVSCGAEVIAPAEQAALTCPYCANNIVLTDKLSGKLRPDGVVPFRIDKKALPGAVQSFYKGKELLPKNFFSDNVMSKVTGVYLPFWIFNGRVTGQLGFRGETVSTHRSGDYIITDTRHYHLNRDADLTFSDVPVDASGRIDDKLTDSLEPFDMREVKPFDVRYLAGFTADRFDQAKGDVAPRARNRMIRSTEQKVASTLIGYSSVRQAGGQLRADLRAKYLLLPVYLFSIKHAGKDYSFAVNGQTGKVVGELPIDKGVSWSYFLLRFGIGLAAVIGFGVVRYLMGG